MYKITIEKVEKVSGRFEQRVKMSESYRDELAKMNWTERRELFKDSDQANEDYRTGTTIVPVPSVREVTTKVLEQVVEELDIKKVLIAINDITKV